MMSGHVQAQITVQQAPLDLAGELAAFHRTGPATGAVVSFVGLMRDLNQGDQVAAMTLEHYPGMTERALESIAEEAMARWDLQAVRVVHRTGELHPSDPIVLVAVATAHRGDAFRACEFLIDYLKTHAPFWKREVTVDGQRRWVDARETDTDAAERWRTQGPGATDR